MLKTILHRIVSIPVVYDTIQRVVGAKQLRDKIKQVLLDVPHEAVVVDIGGGTGLNRALFAEDIRYICLDNDPVKLDGFMQKAVDGHPFLGDAGNIPLPTNSADVVICTAVTHHLPQAVLDGFSQEVMRILKPSGKFVLSDAVWVQTRPMSKLLWRYDRGSFPRTAQVIQQTFARHGQTAHWDEFAILHRYIIGIFKKA